MCMYQRGEFFERPKLKPENQTIYANNLLQTALSLSEIYFYTSSFSIYRKDIGFGWLKNQTL